MGAMERDLIEVQVARHYARSDLEQAILDALVASGKDLERLTPDDLSPVDEFHTGGRQATIDFAAQIDFDARACTSWTSAAASAGRRASSPRSAAAG